MKIKSMWLRLRSETNKRNENYCNTNWCHYCREDESDFGSASRLEVAKTFEFNKINDSTDLNFANS